MCFDQVQFSMASVSIPPKPLLIFPPKFICPYLKKNTKFTQHCQYVHGYRSNHWSIDSLSEVTSLEKTDCPSQSSYQLLTAHHLELGQHDCHLSPAGILSGLIVRRSCACYHNLCEFLCATALLFPENTGLLRLLKTSDF